MAKEERTIGCIIDLTIEENDAIEGLQRLDKETHDRDFKLTKKAIVKQIVILGIPAFRKELLNEADSR